LLLSAVFRCFRHILAGRILVFLQKNGLFSEQLAFFSFNYNNSGRLCQVKDVKGKKQGANGIRDIPAG